MQKVKPHGLEKLNLEPSLEPSLDSDFFSQEILNKIKTDISQAWPESLNLNDRDIDNDFLVREIKKLLKIKDAVLISHYYVDPALQALSEQTEGLVGDSLQMAKFGKSHAAKNLIICGVRFMGETAKILSPEKNVFVPTLKAECSLDLSCPSDLFKKFKAANPDRTAVVYVNTSAEIKALADWCVTSSNALQIIQYLSDQGEKLIFGPDKYLGAYLKKETRADMLLWQGFCVVHEEFKSAGLRSLKQAYPEAAILVHPESPEDVLEMANCVGSTAKLLEASKKLDNPVFIVATENGIFYKMQQASPHKKFISAPTGGRGATCRSCAHCPWMGMNNLKNLYECLLAIPDNSSNFNTLEALTQPYEIKIPEEIIQKAALSLNRMIHFSQ